MYSLAEVLRNQGPRGEAELSAEGSKTQELQRGWQDLKSKLHAIPPLSLLDAQLCLQPALPGHPALCLTGLCPLLSCVARLVLVSACPCSRHANCRRSSGGEASSRSGLVPLAWRFQHIPCLPVAGIKAAGDRRPAGSS